MIASQPSATWPSLRPLRPLFGPFSGLFAGLAGTLVVLGLAGCGDEDAAKDKAVDGGAAGQVDASATLNDGDDQGDATAVDVGAGDAAASNADGGALTDGTDNADGGGDIAGPDAGPDAGAATGDGVALADGGLGDTNADGSGLDAAAGDGGGPGDVGADGGSTSDAGGADAANPCPACPVDKQPTGDHPGAKGACSVQSPKEIAYGGGLGQGYKKMIVYRPSCAGGHPVLFFVHEKGLYNAGGIIGTFGEGYRKFMEHVASHGTVAVFVRVENGLFDGDHDRMAQDLLTATTKLFDGVSVALKDEVVFAGHGMGAKVAVLAAAQTYGSDAKQQWVDPRAVLAFSVDNQKSLLTSNYTDASITVKKIPAAADVAFTFVQAEDDTKTPYKDVNKPNALAIYDGLKVARKQVIVLHGTGKDDPNPPTSPELHDDHSAALTIVGKPGGVTDFTNKSGYLDGLDWYGFWKITVGAIDFHFNKGDKTCAYGALRVHGGNLPNGKVVTHEVVKEQWQ